MNKAPTKAIQFAGRARIGVSFEFFPPKTEEMEKSLWEPSRASAPSRPISFPSPMAPAARHASARTPPCVAFC